MKPHRALILSLFVMLAATTPTAANVTLHPLFADHAVLQQGVPVPIWGQAEPGERVTVEFAGQSVATTSGPDGKWIVRLAPLTVGEPLTLTVRGKNTIVRTNVLVGEVWLCSGQSNMERQLGLRAGQQPITGWEAEVAAANYPAIRHFGVAQTKAYAPQPTVTGSWSVCTPETVKDFTAVGYFFGRELHKSLNVPVGMIHTSWGGTPSESWTSAEAAAAVCRSAGSMPRSKTESSVASRAGRPSTPRPI